MLQKEQQVTQQQMQQGKTVKKKDNFQKNEVVQKTQQKKVSDEQKSFIKFARQTQSKISNQISTKTSLIIPSLDLIKINDSKPQLIDSKEEQNYSYHIKHIKVPETKETKDPLTSNRQTEKKFQKCQSQLQISPSISNRLLQSPIYTLFQKQTSKKDSESLNSQADKEQLLILEIKQLKQENTFLKKKIRDLKTQLNGGYLPEDYQRKSPSSKESPVKKEKKGFPKINIESLHLSVNLFFQEIKNLLNSVTRLFKIEFTEDQVKKFQQLHSEQQIIQELNEEICPLKKHEILKKFYLKRKLQRLAYEEEDKKFDFLLTVFTEYYTFKEQSQKKVVQTIDQMVMYTSDLNRWLIEKAYAKKMKSEVQSQKSTLKEVIQDVSPPKFDSLKIPTANVNYVRKGRGPTLSPNPKTKQTS